MKSRNFFRASISSKETRRRSWLSASHDTRPTHRNDHWRPLVEKLEDRLNLAAFLFIDYGDNFPSGTLTTTTGDFRDVANAPAGADRILGTSMLDKDDNFVGTQALEIQAETFTATERARMLSVIQRAYLPFDITVVELTATAQTLSDGRSVAAASSMTDVVNTLRGGNAAFRDAYVFVGTFVVDPGGPQQATYTGGGGLSPGSTGNVLGEQTDLSAASNVHDDVAVVYSGGGFSHNTVNNIAHEAGHLFGLRHGITNAVATTATNLFHELEIMSYRNTNNTTSSTFMRYPSVRGDSNTPAFNDTATFDAAARTITRTTGSFVDDGFVLGSSIVVSNTTSNNGTFVIQSVAATTITLTPAATLTNETTTARIQSLNSNDYNDLAPRSGDVTNYDQLRTDANVQANPNFTFVSGTGAHDIITITKNGANADVTIQAFADPNYATSIMVPGEADSIYSYSIPLTTTILIYAGGSNDRIIIDGDLGVNVQIDGMLGTDTLIVRGKGAANATYTPNGSAPDGVDLDFGGNPIVSFGGTVTIGSNSIVFLDFETTSAVTIQDVTTVTYVTPGVGNDNLTVRNFGGLPQVDGNVNSGTTAVPMRLEGVDDLVINTGAGIDFLNVIYFTGDPLPAGGLTYNAGGNPNDTLQLGGGAFDLITKNFTNASDGNIALTQGATTRTIAYTGLSPVLMNVGSVTDLVFNLPAGVANNDVELGDDSGVGDTAEIRGSTFENTSFTHPTGSLTINGGNSGNIIDVLALEVTFDADVFINGGTGDDEFTVNRTTGTTNVWTIDGKAGTDKLTIEYAASVTYTNATDGTITSLTGLPLLNFVNIETVEIIGDYGDAPNSYGTLQNPMSQGAYHGAGSVLRLGTNRDDEPNGQPGVNADGDDNNNLDDEDGVVMAGVLIPRLGARFFVTASGAGFIDAWIDFNRNGVFDAGEQIAASFPVVAGSNELVVPEVPANASAGITYARFRLSSTGGLTPISPALDGEVEDYQLTTFVPTPGTVVFIADPENPGTTLLLANGTANSDSIALQPAPGAPGQHRVVLTPFPPTVVGPFSPALYDRFVAFGNQGNDSIGIDAAITKPTALYGDDGIDSIVGGSGSDRIYGGAGNDSIAGGAGADILLGGAGNDYVYGGAGRDLLIGGLGSDWLYGQGDDDIEIGGSTASDNNFAALEQILALWNAVAPFNTRVANTSVHLNAMTVVGDGVVDYLSGNAGQDWFLDFTLQDLVIDFLATQDRKN